MKLFGHQDKNRHQGQKSGRRHFHNWQTSPTPKDSNRPPAVSKYKIQLKAVTSYHCVCNLQTTQRRAWIRQTKRFPTMVSTAYPEEWFKPPPGWLRRSRVTVPGPSAGAPRCTAPTHPAPSNWKTTETVLGSVISQRAPTSYMIHHRNPPSPNNHNQHHPPRNNHIKKLLDI